MPLLKQRPPAESFLELAAAHPEALVQLQRDDVIALLKRADSEYWHWDQLRRRPLPPDLSAEMCWAYLRLLRRHHAIPTPLATPTGEPFTFWIPESLRLSLIEIAQWGRDAVARVHEASERYVVSSLMEEAIASSQLEGAATTREVAKHMLRSGRKPRTHGERMIANNWAAIQWIRERVESPLTEDAILELHRTITADTLPHDEDAGRVRTTDDTVVEYHGEVVHHPPPASLLLERLATLCHFANATNDGIHPVVKAAILHFWVGYDHPFIDGNGRTTRALFYWSLISSGYQWAEYLAISRFYRRAPAQYGRAYLYTESDEGDLTYFIMHSVKVVRQSLQSATNYLDQKAASTRRVDAALRRYRDLNERQRAVVAHALLHPNTEYRIRSHQSVHNVAYNTARTDLLELAARGLLDQVQVQRTFVFRPGHALVAGQEE